MEAEISLPLSSRQQPYLRNRDSLGSSRADRNLEGSNTVRHSLVRDKQDRVVVLSKITPRQRRRDGDDNDDEDNDEATPENERA